MLFILINQSIDSDWFWLMLLDSGWFWPVTGVRWVTCLTGVRVTGGWHGWQGWKSWHVVKPCGGRGDMVERGERGDRSDRSDMSDMSDRSDRGNKANYWLLAKLGWMGYKSWKWDHWLTGTLTGLTCRDASASKQYIYFNRPECVPGNLAFFRVFSFCFLISPIWLFFQLYLILWHGVLCEHCSVYTVHTIQCSVVQIAPPCLCFVISSRCAMCRCPFG